MSKVLFPNFHIILPNAFGNFGPGVKYYTDWSGLQLIKLDFATRHEKIKISFFWGSNKTLDSLVIFFFSS